MSCGQTGRLSVASRAAATRARRSAWSWRRTSRRAPAAAPSTPSCSATTRALRAAESRRLARGGAPARAGTRPLSRRAHAPTVARRFGWSFAVGERLRGGGRHRDLARRPRRLAISPSSRVTSRVAPGAAPGGAAARPRSRSARRGGGEVRLGATRRRECRPTPRWCGGTSGGSSSCARERSPSTSSTVPASTSRSARRASPSRSWGRSSRSTSRGVRTERGKVRLLKPDGSEIAYLERRLRVDCAR